MLCEQVGEKSYELATGISVQPLSLLQLYEPGAAGQRTTFSDRERSRQRYQFGMSSRIFSTAVWQRSHSEIQCAIFKIVVDLARCVFLEAQFNFRPRFSKGDKSMRHDRNGRRSDRATDAATLESRMVLCRIGEAVQHWCQRCWRGRDAVGDLCHARGREGASRRITVAARAGHGAIEGGPGLAATHPNGNTLGSGASGGASALQPSAIGTGRAFIARAVMASRQRAGQRRIDQSGGGSCTTVCSDSSGRRGTVKARSLCRSSCGVLFAVISPADDGIAHSSLQVCYSATSSSVRRSASTAKRSAHTPASSARHAPSA